MELTMSAGFNICRFCLNEENIIPLSEFLLENHLFNVQDIEYASGIKISDEDRALYAICERCRKSLENAISFRRVCLKNDIIFKQLIYPEDRENGEKLIKLEPDETDSEDQEQLLSESNDAETAHILEPEISEPDEKENDTYSTERGENCSQTKPKKKWKRKKQLCGICGQLVTNLTHHTRNHNKEKNYTCSHCQIKMANPTNLKRHIEAVHLKKIVKTCELCGKGFTHRNTYISHMMADHGIGKTYECEICSRSFKHPGTFRAHINKWHKIKEFSCPTCNMIFKDKRQLKRHQSVHSSDQPFKCELCPKLFKSRFARKTHQITHSGIRFQCNLCEKSYRYKSLLNMHYKKDHQSKTTEANETEKV